MNCYYKKARFGKVAPHDIFYPVKLVIKRSNYLILRYLLTLTQSFPVISACEFLCVFTHLMNIKSISIFRILKDHHILAVL